MNPIYNANTVDGTLANTRISSTAIPTTEAFVAPLDNIATRLRPVGPATTGTIQGPWTTATGTLGSNPTNFQTGNMTWDNVVLTVNYLSKRNEVASPEAGRGFNTQGHSEESMIRDLEKDLWALVMLVYSSATYGATDLVTTAANFNGAALGTLGKNCAGQPRTAMVASAALPALANDLIRQGEKWVYPGIDGGVYECLLTGATADVAIVASATSLAYHNEKPPYPQVPPGEISFSEVILPRLRIPVLRASWIDKASRERWVSFDTLFGVAAAELTAMTYAATS